MASATVKERSQDVREAVVLLAERLRLVLGHDLLDVWLYGSWARREGTLESDVDVAVIVKDAHLQTWSKIQEIASKLSLEHDFVLSVNVISLQEWETLKRLQTLYAKKLKNEGVPL